MSYYGASRDFWKQSYRDDGELTGRKQYVELNALSSGTNGKSSSSYRMAVCGEHATYD